MPDSFKSFETSKYFSTKHKNYFKIYDHIFKKYIGKKIILVEIGVLSGGSLFMWKGIGEGTLNSKVPEAHTDYIVSVVSEEFGAIIVIIIILFYLILAYKIIQKINLINKEKIKLILIGSVSLILLQTFVHIGVNIRLLPTTGMTLPYLSYGGSSIISTAIISGIILNLTKRKVN